MKIPPANVREGQAFFLNYLEMRCEVFDASDGNGGAVLYNNAVFEEGASGQGGKGLVHQIGLLAADPHNPQASTDVPPANSSNDRINSCAS